ncbi:uncharacterized protein LOC132713567 [Ruditapes philippinarum]|uniref:uncharacterized protein LOC132713567 n=1 Tax=Ruditapes philippinarum TaxID=129788 RepID=UPI00295B11F1|nr:uncharacterized protein LOC132713567 [Ruditapes philippinarum]XP_060552196.1 uncharacterized protein LOC132713567 [Ruditapes philippinarum]
MVRLTLVLLFVVAVAFVVADEDEDNSCTELKDCPCGSICIDGACTEGCMLYDKFMPAGSESEVYGRKCHCGDTPDEKGMLLECAENVEFVGAPEGVAEWENNPACEVTAEEAPADAATEAPAA